jgi:hypothetical protein
MVCSNGMGVILDNEISTLDGASSPVDEGRTSRATEAEAIKNAAENAKQVESIWRSTGYNASFMREARSGPRVPCSTFSIEN